MTIKEASRVLEYKAIGIATDYLLEKMPPQVKEFYDALDIAIDVLVKADKYRWHDLRKNPNDLPTTWDDGRYYNCVLEGHLYDGYYNSFLYHEGLGFGFENSIFDNTSLGFVDCIFETVEELGIEKVIAWREIEPFEEETDES